MKDKFKKCLKIVFPFKKINFFVLSLFLFGLILGAVFSTTISINDRNLVIEKITTFINNINDGLIDYGITFKNSLSINYIYLFFILILGMTLIGIIFNIILLFLKGFIIGFSLASFIITFGYKGIILSSLYLIFGQLLNILVMLVATIYSIVFSYKLLLVIFKNKNIELKHFFKSYLFISAILIVISLISSVSESWLLPMFIKLISNIFI